MVWLYVARATPSRTIYIYSQPAVARISTTNNENIIIERTKERENLKKEKKRRTRRRAEYEYISFHLANVDVDI